MTTGYSGTYAFNGTNLTLPPSQGKWSDRDILGLDGNGRPIYPSVREFTMTWELMDVTSLQQLINAQLSVANTGSSVVDLPKWGASAYLFDSYSGCFINEVVVGQYFAEHVESVNLLITNIRTN